MNNKENIDNELQEFEKLFNKKNKFLQLYAELISALNCMFNSFVDGSGGDTMFSDDLINNKELLFMLENFYLPNYHETYIWILTDDRLFKKLDKQLLNKILESYKKEDRDDEEIEEKYKKFYILNQSIN